jgi:hypothetical protein
MKHDHPPIHVFAITALVIGLSISGGPIVWAVLIMASPLILIFMMRGMAHRGLAHAAYERSHPIVIASNRSRRNAEDTAAG